MKIKSPFLMKLGGFVAAQLVRSWMGTLDYKGALYDRTVDPVHPDYHGQKIYIFWHEYILSPLALRGHCDLAMLVKPPHGRRDSQSGGLPDGIRRRTRLDEPRRGSGASRNVATKQSDRTWRSHRTVRAAPAASWHPGRSIWHRDSACRW